ncbi:Protease 4 [bacterium HR11]|nr:Protease 4 [bacterium HR11]
MKRRTLVGCLIALALLGFLIIAGVYFFQQAVGRAPLPRSFVLRLDLQGELMEFVPFTPWEVFQVRRPLSVWEMVRAIDTARQDDRVRGLVLVVRDVSAGLAKLQELHAALQRFRQSGKKVAAYVEEVGDAGYLVASAADSVTAPPGGFLVLNGVRGAFMALKGFLDKLGIEFQMVQYGPYKSAADVFTKESISPEVREMLTWIATSLDRQYRDSVVRGRPIPRDRWADLVARGIFTAESALAAKLIDRIEPWSEFEQRMRTEWSDRWVSLRRYYDAMPEPKGRERVRCALVFAVGGIFTGRGNPGENIGSERYVEWLDEIARDKTIRCVLIRNDSPGGSGTASDQILAAVERVKKAGKVVVVSMSDVAGSGGYYISMNADRIVAQPGTITGSIGVFAGKPVFQKTMDKLGIHVYEIYANPKAGMWSPFAYMTEDQLHALQEEIGRFYQMFVAKVAQHRKMSYEAVDAIAQGRIWTGEQAQEHRLVDRLGGFPEAQEEILSLLKKPKDTRIEWKVYPRRRTPWEVLLEIGESDSFPARLRRDIDGRGVLPRLLESYLAVLQDPVLLVMPPVGFGFHASP